MKHTYYLIIIIIFSISCGSLAKKPKPEIKNLSFHVNGFGKQFYKTQFASAKNFSKKLQKIEKISIRYTIEENNDSDTAKKQKKPYTSYWEKQLETNLLKKGLTVKEGKDRSDLLTSITDEINNTKEKTINTCDATLVIDKLKIQKVTSTYHFSITKQSAQKGSYTYSYYIAEISGKIVTKNNDIIWIGNIMASSFNLLNHKKKSEPQITVRAVRDYSYSHKQDKWVKIKWSIDTITDNFQNQYSGKVKTDFHVRDLVTYTVTGFIKGLR